MIQMDKEAQAEAVRKALEKLAETEFENVKRAVRLNCSSPEGRDFLWWLLRTGRFGSQPFNADPYLHAFNSGELNVGQQVFALIIEAEPTGYFRILEDQLDADRKRTVAANAAIARDTDDTPADEPIEPGQ